MAGMVREAHCVDGPDLAAEPLQRESGGRVPDMPVAHLRLDGEDVQGRYLRPSAQATSLARSAPVISLTLPGGMARPSPACMKISRACAAISSSVSRSTPLGATGRPGHPGSLAWHMPQCWVTMSRT